MKDVMNKDKCTPHYVKWSDHKIKKYWDVYETHPALFRNLIFIPGTHKNPTLDAVVNKLCKLVPRNSKILDIGFGNGYVIKKMALQGYECFGIDISERNVNLTLKEILEDDRLNKKNITLKVGNILQLSSIFGNNLFDLIIATDFFEHLNDETIYKGFQRISRCLKKGGYLFISTPYKEVLRKSFVLCPDCHAIFHSVGHVQSFDEKRMISMLKRHNFRVTECTTKLHHITVRSYMQKIYVNLLRVFKIYNPETRSYTQNLYTISQKI